MKQRKMFTRRVRAMANIRYRKLMEGGAIIADPETVEKKNQPSVFKKSGRTVCLFQTPTIKR